MKEANFHAVDTCDTCGTQLSDLDFYFPGNHGDSNHVPFGSLTPDMVHQMINNRQIHIRQSRGFCTDIALNLSYHEVR